MVPCGQHDSRYAILESREELKREKCIYFIYLTTRFFFPLSTLMLLIVAVM